MIGKWKESNTLAVAGNRAQDIWLSDLWQLAIIHFLLCMSPHTIEHTFILLPAKVLHVLFLTIHHCYVTYCCCSYAMNVAATVNVQNKGACHFNTKKKRRKKYLTLTVTLNPNHSAMRDCWRLRCTGLPLMHQPTLQYDITQCKGHKSTWRKYDIF